MKKNKALTAANRMPLYDYTSYMFRTFGIEISDQSSYFGFVRKDSRFIIRFPILQDGHIVNFLLENMRSTVVRTFEDVKYYIRAEERRAPEYFQTLYEEMKGVTSK